MPYYWEHTSAELRLNKAFKHGGTGYPKGWLGSSTPEQRAELGIVWEEDDRPRRNEKYYRISGKKGEWVAGRRDLDELKANEISSIKTTAASRLSGSDWYVTRASETDKPVPEDWVTYRQDTREYSDTLEGLVSAAEDIEGLIAVNAEWPESPDEKEQREKAEALSINSGPQNNLPITNGE